jgi:hypothetical protein
MEAMPRRGRPRQSSRRHFPSNGRGAGDRLALVHDRERVDLIAELDGVYDVLLGQALNGNNRSYELAATVKMATDYLIDLRLNAAR